MIDGWFGAFLGAMITVIVALMISTTYFFGFNDGQCDGWCANQGLSVRTSDAACACQATNEKVKTGK